MFKSAHAKVAAFTKNRSRQTDDAFFHDLGLSHNEPAALIALAIRRAVATAGLVDPTSVPTIAPIMN